jgi:hypothetical protein
MKSILRTLNCLLLCSVANLVLSQNVEFEKEVLVNVNSAPGSGQIKLTETEFDYSRITLNNNIHANYWDVAARTDTNLSNAVLNIYHSDAGEILSVSARKRVGINDSSPAYPLEINGNGESRAVNIYNTGATTTTTTFNYGVLCNLAQASNTGFVRLFNLYGFSTDPNAYLSYGAYGYATNATMFNYGLYGVAGTSKGYAVYASGNTYTTGAYLPSDAKLKSDIHPIVSGLKDIMALKPKTYKYDTEKYDFMNLPEGEQFGFLAQDIEELFPTLTKKTFQGYDEPLSDTPEGQGIEFKAVNYIALIPVMVAAIQEQQEIIAAQKNELLAFEQRLANLELMVNRNALAKN